MSARKAIYPDQGPVTRRISLGLAQSVERLTAEREVKGSITGGEPILRVLK